MLNELLGGTIIESDTNQNGTYIKYSDGTLICCKNIAFSSIAITQDTGNVLYTSADLDMGSYPYTFVSKPTLNASKVRNYAGFIYNISQETQDFSKIGTVKFGCGRGWSSSAWGVDIIAIGRWK